MAELHFPRPPLQHAHSFLLAKACEALPGRALQTQRRTPSPGLVLPALRGHTWKGAAPAGSGGTGQGVARVPCRPGAVGEAPEQVGLRVGGPCFPPGEPVLRSR